MDELQEAKLRALGVSFGDEPPEPSISPPTTVPSRQASAQYPSLPFSPPIPPSSASSGHGAAGFPFPAQFFSGVTSPGLSSGTSPIPFAPPKFNPRQSISLSTGNSPFQLTQAPLWGHTNLIPSSGGSDSPLAGFSGVLSPQTSHGLEGFERNGSPGFGLLQRQQSLQYFPQQASTIVSPRLQDVREADEEVLSKSPSKTPEPPRHYGDHSRAGAADNAEYHLEEQLRNQLEHEDYNPQSIWSNNSFVSSRNEEPVAQGLAIAERFASEPGNALELHHPRPNSRGQSLSKNFFRDHDEPKANVDENGFRGNLPSLQELPKSSRTDNGNQMTDTSLESLEAPVHEFDFGIASRQHQRRLSATSNPWQNTISGANSARHSSHNSKSSFAKLNVEAPEFKFGQSTSFPSGIQNFTGGSDSQPAIFTAEVGTNEIDSNQDSTSQTQPPLFNAAVPQFGGSKMHASAPSFSPGQSIFSFSTSGPKFRPDAPTFTPLQPAADVPEGSGRGHASRQDSLFGNINVSTNSGLGSKKSKAIPIVRPSSRSSADERSATDQAGQPEDDPDGRLPDESRVKRAKSAISDGDSLPRFAERPDENGEASEAPHTFVDAIDPLQNDHIAVTDVSSHQEQPLQIDTSISAMSTSDHMDHMDTLNTTAESSEASSVDSRNLKVLPSSGLESQSQKEPQTFSSGEKYSDEVESSTRAAPSAPLAAGASLIMDEHTGAEEGDEKDALAEEEAPAGDNTHIDQAVPPTAAPSPKGLAASRFARPDSISSYPDQQSGVIRSIEDDSAAASAAAAIDPHPGRLNSPHARDDLTFSEIDAVMQQMEDDPSMGIHKTIEASPRQPGIAKSIDISFSQGAVSPTAALSRDGASLTPRPLPAVSGADLMAKDELEDPFVDPPTGSRSSEIMDEFINSQNASEQGSDWEAAYTEDEQKKPRTRAQFDGRVHEVIGNLFASRLEPLEKTLALIQDSLALQSRRSHSTRREVRSISGDMQDSDADDEDEDPAPQRSASPRRDRRMDQMRLALTEALVAHQRNQAPPLANDEDILSSAAHSTSIIKSLEEMKEHMLTNLRSASVMESQESGVREQESRVSGSDESAQQKLAELQAMMMDLGERLTMEQKKTEKEITERRVAEDTAAELSRQLQAAETRVEVEIIKRSVLDQRAADLEERLRLQEDKTEAEVKSRRLAEDRLSEVQRLLRISSEEENRLRESVEERDANLKTLEQQSAKNAMRMTLLEAAQDNAAQSQSEIANKCNILEADLKAVRQDNNHWRSEAERADESARRATGELAHAAEENKHLQKSLTTLATQLEENERLRETWRTKFLSLQDDVNRAAREIGEENARRIKKDQVMLARQDVLDAKLQAEAKTRERLEVEMERLQDNERSGMRAVNECNRLEGVLVEMRKENHRLQQAAMRYQREFEEARESGASEVNRTRMAMQTEVDAANNHVNVVREELEEQSAKLRADLDNAKLEADTAKAQSEMLLEEAQSTMTTELEAAKQKHQGEMEDIQARFERQINDVSEEASRSEQQLLERLSLSSSKIEHLQDRVLHLEDKLEIAREAATAAARAAKAAGGETNTTAAAVAQLKQLSKPVELPEKISPQALRESIMVLQEQLQDREQRVEELEQSLSKMDPEAATKISKRDDEISWLRELLAVRHSDLQDVITALSGDDYDRDAVKDATIRLKANLQMEEQERERAMNGGSAISLPNIAQTIQAATPRVAQTIGPIAAAWGNWRKANQPSLRAISGALSTPASTNNATPSRIGNNPKFQNGLLSGLLTPPASGLRPSSSSDDSKPQPTAFASTGRRYPYGTSAPGRGRGQSNSSQRLHHGLSGPDTPPRHQERSMRPTTPPMMKQSSYDSDAQPGDFDDHDFFEDDD